MDLRTQHFQNMVIAALHLIIQMGWFFLGRKFMDYNGEKLHRASITNSVEEWTKLVGVWQKLDKEGK